MRNAASSTSMANASPGEGRCKRYERLCATLNVHGKSHAYAPIAPSTTP